MGTDAEMLFKFLKQEHLKLLLDEDKLRIGSSRQYKRLNMGPMVRDPNEGVLLISGEAHNVENITHEEYPGLAGIIGGGSIGHLSVQNMRRVAPEFLMFCCSVGYDIEAHKKWNAHEQYDACYKINNPEGFFTAITRKLHGVCGVNQGRHGPVNYYPERGFDFRDKRSGLPPEFTKAAKTFADQTEYRVVWPNYDRGNNHPDYFDLHIRGISRYVSKFWQLRPTSIKF